MVEVGDYMTPGSPCALVIDEDPFLIVGQVPERDVDDLETGSAGEARLVSGQRVAGTIRFVAKSADPATRTFLVELEVPNPDGQLRDGITAELRVPTKTVVAHKITPAILALDDQGRIGVRIVVAERVRYVPVEIVSDGADGIWVSGLPASATVITVGQDYVADGEKVRAVAEDDPSVPLAIAPPPVTQALR